MKEYKEYIDGQVKRYVVGECFDHIICIKGRELDSLLNNIRPYGWYFVPNEETSRVDIYADFDQDAVVCQCYGKPLFGLKKKAVWAIATAEYDQKANELLNSSMSQAEKEAGLNGLFKEFCTVNIRAEHPERCCC